MAKSSRRRKQDRARVDSRHAEEARRRARRQAEELFERATNPALEPTELAALIIEELAESTRTGLIAHTRLEDGTELAALAETAQLLLAAFAYADPAGSPSPRNIPPGVLAFVAVAAHASGKEEEEARCTQALVDAPQAVGDEETLKVVARDVLTWTDPGKAVNMLERYLVRHPHDLEALTSWGRACGRVAESALRGRYSADIPAALVAGPSDPSDPEYLLRILENGRRVWEADPLAKARFQASSAFGAEIMRRRRMPPLEAERLWRTEAEE